MLIDSKSQVAISRLELKLRLRSHLYLQLIKSELQMQNVAISLSTNRRDKVSTSGRGISFRFCPHFWKIRAYWRLLAQLLQFRPSVGKGGECGVEERHVLNLPMFKQNLEADNRYANTCLKRRDKNAYK